MGNNNDKLLTPDETVLYLGVDKDTLNVWKSARRYDIPYIKVSKTQLNK